MAIQQDKSKKVKVAVGVAAAGVAAAAIGLGTYAAFTDTETGTGTAAAGTLDLELGGTGTQELFTATNMQPGDEKEVTFTVHNVGTLPGLLDGTLQVTGSEGAGDGACTEPEEVAGGCNGDGDLQDQLTVAVAGPGVTPTEAEPLTTFEIPESTLTADATGTYTLTFTLPDRPDNNKVQGDSIEVAATLNLEQVNTPADGL